VYSTATGCILQLQGVFYSYRVYSTATGCILQLQGVFYSYRVYVLFTLCRKTIYKFVQ